MSQETPASLPGDKLRKAVQEYSELIESMPDADHNKRMEIIAQKFDLSPLESEFLDRQLKNNSTSGS